jgi:hypothetical protein
MYCQLLEEATRQLKNEAKPTRPEAHVELGISAFLPKTYIPADRQRMDIYRRLTRCTSVEMLGGLEKDMADAFGPPPRQAVLLLALTEVRLLSQLFGISSIIKKDPDVVLTVADAARAQLALAGAPGTLRVIDEKTVYLRMPPTFMQADALLLTLKNLMRQAHDREQRGEVAAEPGKAPEKPPEKVPHRPKARPVDREGEVQKDEVRPAVKLGAGGKGTAPARKPPAPEKAASAPATSLVGELEKLASLRQQGILTEEEFQTLKQRLVAGATAAG